ncbi:Ankyrin repeat-containing protein [Arachis hypogaea]|nr:Ankyrin repeat-containing protein [Arachis hypogaea]
MSFFRRGRHSHRTISLSSLASHELLPPPLLSRLLPWSPSLQSSFRRSHRVCSLHSRRHRALSAAALVAFAPLVNFRKRFQIDNNIEMPELCPEWLALLIFEKACLSSISLYETSGVVCKTGRNFKEKLRELGGLDAVFEITLKCQSDLKEINLSSRLSFVLVDFKFCLMELVLGIISENGEEELKELLSKTNNSGETALYVAAENDNLDIVKELIKYHDISLAGFKAKNGFDAFHIAAKNGNLEILKVLMEAFPEVSKTVDMSNTTALHTAAAQG